MVFGLLLQLVICLVLDCCCLNVILLLLIVHIAFIYGMMVEQPASRSNVYPSSSHSSHLSTSAVPARDLKTRLHGKGVEWMGFVFLHTALPLACVDAWDGERKTSLSCCCCRQKVSLIKVVARRPSDDLILIDGLGALPLSLDSLYDYCISSSSSKS